jgi:hypothetical protein
MQRGRKLAAEAESLEKRGHEIQGRRNLYDNLTGWQLTFNKRGENWLAKRR